MVRLTHSDWLCIPCGAVFAVPADQDPTMVIHVPVDRRRQRRFLVDSVAVHCCAIEQAAPDAGN